MEKEVLKLYKAATKEIQAGVNDIWLKMLSDGEINISSLYNYNRYKAIQDTINKELNKLGKEEIDIINSHLEEAYIKTFGESIVEMGGEPIDTSWGQFNKESVNSIVNANFKGATWSDRIWENQDILRGQLQQKVIDSAILGKDVRKVAKDLSKRMEVSLSDSNRIIRTETMRVLNDGCKNAAIQRGYEKYEFLAAIDDRTSQECKQLNGKIFELASGVVGVNMPPIHPNCRSTILPVIK